MWRKYYISKNQYRCFPNHEKPHMLEVKNSQILQNKYFSEIELLLDKQHCEMLPDFKHQKKESHYVILRKLSYFFHQPLQCIINNTSVSEARDFGFISIPVKVGVM